jgi:hypothetical protein
MEPLGGIAEADGLLGRAFPLPAAVLPLARWTDVVAVGGGAEVQWNFDDSRAGAPGRLALYAGREPAPPQLDAAAEMLQEFEVRAVPLPGAEPSLRPVFELRWATGGLHLRLTAQGPWRQSDVVALARSVAV